MALLRFKPCSLPVFFLTIGLCIPLFIQTKPYKKKVRLESLIAPIDIKKNVLTGYGLVAGLPQTGDRQSKLSKEILQKILSYYKTTSAVNTLQSKNIAAVIVTAQLEGFLKKGDTIQAQVASIGDASSLKDGYLIITPLHAPNGIIYATAYGNVLAQEKKNTGKIPDGAVIERNLRKDAPLSIATNKYRLQYRIKHQFYSSSGSIKQQIEQLFPEWIAYLSPNAYLEISKKNASYFSMEEEKELLATSINLLIFSKIVIDVTTKVIVSGSDVPLQDFYFSFPKKNRSVFSRKSNRDKTPIPKIKGISQLLEYLKKYEATEDEIISIFNSLKKMGYLPEELFFIN